ncbi:MAG: microcystin degradation protein MlrC [Candidatus Latescibacterota bacterium]|jgi:microcystin degradation protein MlrC
MRIAIAEISQETDTFSPIPTTLRDFEQTGLYFGSEILEKMQGVGKIGGFLNVAQHEPNVEYLPILRARATSGGRITDQTLSFLTEKLIQGLQDALPFDVLYLSLHGAASSQSIDDLEGHVLQEVRDTIGHDIPIIVPLDHHANITQKIMDLSTLIIGYEEQPHDQVETGERAGKLLFRLLKKEITPTGAWFKIPMITPQDQFLTSQGPMKTWFDLAREIEARPGALTASTFPMQPWIDVEEGGWAAMVYTQNNPTLAKELAAELANKAWELRDAFWQSERVSILDAVQQADQANEGLVILSDTGDSVYGGAPGDNTVILAEMLKQNIQSTAFVPVVDAEATEKAASAGVGAQITLDIGGKLDNVFSQPVRITATVSAISTGLHVKLGDRDYCDMGQTALLEAGPIKIVLAKDRIQAINYPIMYTHLGLDINDAKMIVLKTASNFQYFAPWRKHMIRVDAPGMTQSNLKAFNWQRIPRPIYPLDNLPEWQASR